MSIATAPSTQKGQATRERILAAARKIAIENDGHLEIAAVAQEAGVVPGLVHRYFGSKAGLVTALVDDFFDRFHARVFDLDLQDRGNWAEHERLRLELGVQFHYEEPFSVVLNRSLGREAEVARRQEEREAAMVDLVALSIRTAQTKGELPAGIDPGLGAAAMMGAMRGVLMESLTRKKRPKPQQVVEVLWRQVEASVGLERG